MQNTNDPSQAQGAQIALDSFTIPSFPSTAAGLKTLTLTSQIPAAKYQSQLLQPFMIPASIPYGIESLTLELFSLGYPPGFLTALAERLPNLKSVVVYSQLFSGTTKESQDDAIGFFKSLKSLRALHLLDVYARPGFFRGAAPWLRYNTSEIDGEARRGLMFLEVNYTYDPDDSDMMTRIAAAELPALIGPGLISCSLNISPLEDESGVAVKDGIMAFNQGLATSLVAALTTEEDTYPRGLRALNTTLFTVSLTQLKMIAERHKSLTILNATVSLQPDKNIRQDLTAILRTASKLEQFEMVGHPTLPFFMQIASPNSTAFEQACPTRSDLEGLTVNDLTNVKLNILRSQKFGSIEYKKDTSGWKKL